VSSDLLPQTVISVSGQGAGVYLGEPGNLLSVALSISGWTGAGSITFSVEWSFDGVTYFPSENGDAFLVLSAARKILKSFTRRAAFARLVWTVAGVVTATVKAEWTMQTGVAG
jgi:hypothetical protein